MWHRLSTGVSFPLLLWITAFVVTVESMGIGSMETGSMGIESSDNDAAVGSSFQTVGNGHNSGIRDNLNEVYRTQKEFDAFWALHSDGNHPRKPPPPVDFTTRMVAVVFLGEKTSGGFAVHVTSVERKEDGELVVNFTAVAPPPGAMLTMALTQPYHIVSVGITDMDVIFEGSQAAKTPRPRPSTYIVSFEKGVDVAAKVTQFQNDPRVTKVHEMKSLKMAFVNFDSEKNNDDEVLAFLQGVEGVKNVEADQAF